MTLSCSCGDPGNYDWLYYPGNDFSTLQTKRRRRCCSCKNALSPGDTVLVFDRVRSPAYEIEERIYGDEVPLATWYMCEPCGEIYLNLEDAGFCLNIEDNMRDNLREYHELTGFKREAV